MRLTYSYIYSYENKYHPVGGNASNNLKKLTFQLFMRLNRHLSRHKSFFLTPKFPMISLDQLKYWFRSVYIG